MAQAQVVRCGPQALGQAVRDDLAFLLVQMRDPSKGGMAPGLPALQGGPGSAKAVGWGWALRVGTEGTCGVGGWGVTPPYPPPILYPPGATLLITTSNVPSSLGDPVLTPKLGSCWGSHLVVRVAQPCSSAAIVAPGDDSLHPVKAPCLLLPPKCQQ